MDPNVRSAKSASLLPTLPFLAPSDASLFDEGSVAANTLSGGVPSFPALRRDTTGHPVVGQRLGDFELLAELGRGASGQVFLARQMSLNREVALKVSERQDGEARTQARLEHDHIVRVYDEEVDSSLRLRLLWMQYVAGASLEQIIRRLDHTAWAGRDFLAAIDSCGQHSPPPDRSCLRDREELEAADAAETVCRLGARLADALAHAHARRVIHRDVKPANILISRSGRPLLADFNLAVQRREDLVCAERVGGTLAYMAPEHLDAFAGIAPPSAVDARSDIYSLGVVLFEMLTGRRPFDDATDVPLNESTLFRLAAERRLEAPSSRRLQPAVPDLLDRVVRRCLDPDPARRYQSAGELAEDLDGCLEFCRAEMNLPRPGPITRAALRQPLVVSVILSMTPHILGAVIDLAYNILWLSSRPDGTDLLRPFVTLALSYTAVAFLITGWLTYVLGKPIYAAVVHLRDGGSMDRDQVAALRKKALAKPVWALVLSGVGWLPGGFMVPAMLNAFVRPFAWDVYLHFALSFALAGLIALTYNALGSQFLMLRVVYPRLWVDARDQRATARRELVGVDRLIWVMQLLSGLVPLAVGAALLISMIGVDSHQAATASYQTFQLLILGLIGFGMAGCWLAVLISRRLEATLAALTGR